MRVIVEIVITRCPSVNPLGQPLRHRVIHLDLLALVAKRLRQRRRDVQAGIRQRWKGFPRKNQPRLFGNRGLARARQFSTVCRRSSGPWRFHRDQCFQAFCPARPFFGSIPLGNIRAGCSAANNCWWRICCRATAEPPAKGSNPRFLVTNLTGAAQELYDAVYCARGEMENRIKEQPLGLFADRTRCHGWWANQFRLLLSSFA